MIEEVFDDYDTNEDGLDKEELRGGELRGLFKGDSGVTLGRY